MARREKKAPAPSAKDAELLIIKRLLWAGAIFIGLITAFEWSHDLLTPWNRWLEPGIAIWFAVLAAALTRWSTLDGVVRMAAVTSFNLYLIVNTLALLFWAPQPVDQYQFLTTVYWLPFGYGAAFLFLRINHALVFCLLAFMTLCLPIWTTFWLMGGLYWGEGFASIVGMLGVAQLTYIALWTAVAVLRANYYRSEERTRLLESLAFSDPLTSLPNRRALATQMEIEIATAHRHGAPVCAVMIDIDHFKCINDNFGHQSGDQVLQKMGPLLLENLRITDALCRWGGEEFLVVCTATRHDTCLEISERLRMAVEGCVFAHQKPVTISVGVASLRSGEGLTDLVERADNALYRAKNLGRNRVEFAG